MFRYKIDAFLFLTIESIFIINFSILHYAIDILLQLFIYFLYSKCKKIVGIKVL